MIVACTTGEMGDPSDSLQTFQGFSACLVNTNLFQGRLGGEDPGPRTFLAARQVAFA